MQTSHITTYNKVGKVKYVVKISVVTNKTNTNKIICHAIIISKIWKRYQTPS